MENHGRRVQRADSIGYQVLSFACADWLWDWCCPIYREPIGATVRCSPRLAEKTVLHRGDALDRLAGERSLVGRSSRVFQVFESRDTDQRRRNRFVRND